MRPRNRTLGHCTSRAVLLALLALLAIPQLLIAQQFIDETTTRFPSPAPSEYSNQVAIADIDGDGDLDVSFANGPGFSSPGTPQKVRVYINDGSGFFTDETDARNGGFTGYARDVEYGDVDGDGDLDCVVANDFNNPPRLLINDGTGFFTDESGIRLPTMSLGSPHVALGDVDDDGDLDLWFANGGVNRFGSGQAQLWINDGSGVFANETASRLPQQLVPQPSDCIFGDVDGDFDLDMLEGHLGSNNTRQYINDGTGVFTQVAYPNDSSCYSYDFGDFDADGDLDLLGANGFPGSNREIITGNDGAGVFTNITNSVLPLNQNPNVDDNDSKFFDYDNDGDLDFIVARIFGAERIYQNDGTGNFTQVPGTIQTITDSTLDVEVGDLDGDGALDVVTAQGESGSFINRVYMNSGPADTIPTTFPGVEVLTDTVDPGPYVLHFTIRDDMTGDNGFHRESATLTYTVDDQDPVEIDLVHMGHDMFRIEIPAQPAGSIITYEAHATDLAGNSASSPSHSFMVLGPFLRGDANNDGTLDALSDSVFLLNFGFTPGSPAPVCDDAADVNDDGELQPLLEAIYLLSFGFVPGSPVIPAPYPDCGVDPTPDALQCAPVVNACP